MQLTNEGQCEDTRKHEQEDGVSNHRGDISTLRRVGENNTVEGLVKIDEGGEREEEQAEAVQSPDRSLR